MAAIVNKWAEHFPVAALAGGSGGHEKARAEIRRACSEFGRELLRGPRYGKYSFAEVIVVFLVVVTSTRWCEIQLAWPGNAQHV
jgi:hypothetical protein